ncbi:VOC family protein [Pseudoduganella albidiflava]|uniref:Extradiol dioxygenase n=1 Tax=Pseudoduganella albidiflava TaxID=321983 RepID=A0A411X1R0_9BURK|nr:VOC family protein [Pseudoduganella albidiflava]QBI02792.1 glyoxalase/bleomycin resistance/extradiol dioxygenase family protein [Pseudoduganella albidiflava]GGY56327.1 extradiol dioxygenase [Pseudoduganella albidiflava]
MNKQIFVNLPVSDLDKSKEFFQALGYTFNAQFTNESGACLVIAEGSIYAMLLTHAFFKTFIDKPIAQAKEATGVLICLSCESREEVDGIVAKAIAAGGRAPRAPQDHGFMYSHAFEDLDGHVWELVWMAQQE